MVGCAPARDVSAGYISWGHSIVTDPWGRVIDMLDEKKEFFWLSWIWTMKSR
ncbi:MAG: hypothetical protein ACLUPF_05770 [Dorea sp.]